MLTFKGTKPMYRVWLVQEEEDGTPKWTEVSGLWPNKADNGFSGKLSKPIAATEGRIVVLLANEKKEG
ncbi:MAG: hypothetical protein AAFV59_18365 [Pseudomonadota bacterium]